MTRTAIHVSLLIAGVLMTTCASEVRSQATPTAAKTPTATKAPTIDQSLELFSVSSPKISPDGKRVVYEQSRTNWDANAFETNLWIADAATGERHPLTTAGNSCNSADWSPDGRWIAFLSDRPGVLPKSPEGKRQLWVMPANGGEAQQLTKMEKGVDGFDWSPDSERIAVSAEAPEPKAMKDRKESFGDYQVIHADYEKTHLWILDLPKMDAAGRVSAINEPKELTKDDTFSVGEFSFSPDGTKIAFDASRDPDLISIFSKGHLRRKCRRWRSEEACGHARPRFNAGMVARWEADCLCDFKWGEVLLLYKPENCRGGCEWRSRTRTWRCVR